jgi:hypothetical protein
MRPAAALLAVLLLAGCLGRAPAPAQHEPLQPSAPPPAEPSPAPSARPEPAANATQPPNGTAPAPPGPRAAFDALLCPRPLPDVDPARPLERCNVRATAHSGPANEVMLAMDPRDSLHLVAVAKGYNVTSLGPATTGAVGLGVRTVYATTFDGGATWVEGYLQALSPLLDAPVAGGVGPTTDVHTDPIVALLPSGRAVAMSEYGPNATGSLPSYVSDDGGRTFALGSTVYPAETDEPWLAVGEQGELYVATLNFGEGGSDVVRSLDGGATWSPPLHRCACDDPRIAAGPDGEVVLVGTAWRGPSDDRGFDVVFTRSLDRGLTWEPSRTIGVYHGRDFNIDDLRLYRAPNFPIPAVDRSHGPGHGTIYVLWADHPPGSLSTPCVLPPELSTGLPSACFAMPDWDVYLMRSRDGGATWSQPLRVNDDDPAVPASQFMPTIAVGPSGDVHVAWLDQRNDPGGLLAEAFYAHSPDGERFERNIDLSDAPFPVVLSHHQSAIFWGFVGDYIGLAASDDRAVVAFPDTRYGQADVFVATVV